MRVFVLVSESGSFSAAAKRLNCSPAMVGKYIESLECHLHAKLIVRTTRQQRLTYAGVVFLESAKALLNQVRRAEDEVASLSSANVGTIRVSAPPVLGGLIVAPYVARFSIEHPELEIDLVLSNQFVELIEDNFDVIVRVGDVRSTSCIARSIGDYRMLTVAAPEYISRAGEPQSPADLEAHSCIVQRSCFGPIEWHLGDNDFSWPKSGCITSTDSFAIMNIALNAGGIAIIPEILARKYLASNALLEVLPMSKPRAKPVSLLYLDEKFARHSLGGFIDSLVVHLRNGLRPDD